MPDLKVPARASRLVDNALTTGRRGVKAFRQHADKERGVAVNETLNVAGPTASETTARLVELMTDAGCTHAKTGPNVYKFARSTRPAGLTVGTGVATIVTLGVAAPTLFMRRVDECTATIVESPTGSTVTVVGKVPASAITTLRNGLGTSAWRLAAAVKPVNEPVVEAPSDEVSLEEADDTRTALRADRLASNATLKLVLDSGETFVLRSSAVLGRAPNREMWPDHAVLIVTDPDRSISKTHVRIAVEGPSITVEDLGSTNGTKLETAAGKTVNLSNKEPHALTEGCEITLGARLISVRRAE